MMDLSLFRIQLLLKHLDGLKDVTAGRKMLLVDSDTETCLVLPLCSM